MWFALLAGLVVADGPEPSSQFREDELLQLHVWRRGTLLVHSERRAQLSNVTNRARDWEQAIVRVLDVPELGHRVERSLRIATGDSRELAVATLGTIDGDSDDVDDGEILYWSPTEPFAAALSQLAPRFGRAARKRAAGGLRGRVRLGRSAYRQAPVEVRTPAGWLTWPEGSPFLADEILDSFWDADACALVVFVPGDDPNVVMDDVNVLIGPVPRTLRNRCHKVPQTAVPAAAVAPTVPPRVPAVWRVDDDVYYRGPRGRDRGPGEFMWSIAIGELDDRALRDWFVVPPVHVDRDWGWVRLAEMAPDGARTPTLMAAVEERVAQLPALPTAASLWPDGSHRLTTVADSAGVSRLVYGPASVPWPTAAGLPATAVLATFVDRIACAFFVVIDREAGAHLLLGPLPADARHVCTVPPVTPSR